ncbi:MAG: ABC transporter permease [Bacteroidales bacterium]|nr:ABC transporter permease [Bacteroidales bacterium]MDD3892260.1 ABC transporter permease [Bacteroidales bacterium]
MLKKLLTIEGHKTLFYPTFRTIVVIHALLFLLVAIVAGNISLNIEGIRVDKVFQFPHVWNTLAWIASWFNLLLGVLAILLVSNEFQYKTFKKHIIDGLSRNEILLSKLIVFALLAAYTMLLVFISGLLFGIIKSSSFSVNDFIQGLPYLPVLFIQSLGYMLLGMLMAFIFKNSAFSIVAFLLYFFPVEPILRAFLPNGVAAFMPAKTIANLTPMPNFLGISLSDAIQMSSSSSGFEVMGLSSHSVPLLTTTLIAAGYCLLFAFAAKLIVTNKNF